MKKVLAVLVIGLFVLVISSTAFAATTEQQPSDQERYQQMYEACHGPNGYMTKYFNGGDSPQGYGMMGDYSMMRGFGSQF
jgi:mono/diheme cytochrome c family protein